MSGKSRGQKAIRNTLAALEYEAIALICGLILPRLILSTFGSAYNGIISSITQFLSCIALLQAGIGSVTQAALYKPLIEEDNKKISGILRSTELFMRKVALIFAAIIVVFACIYPFFIKDEFRWSFSASLVIIIGIGTFAQYYFGITYQILLTADQRQDIIYKIQIITTILNTVSAAVIIKFGGNIHVVKLGSSMVFCLNPILTNIYVKKHYRIEKHVKSDNSAMRQRWDAFAHEVANFVNSNTDIIVLTLFENVKIVSVYTVYYMVINNISKLLKNTMGGIRAAFGNMIAKEQYNVLNSNLKVLELYIFMVSDFLFIVTGITIVPFVMVYTSGIVDVNYARVSFAIISTIAAYFSCVRLSYVNIVQAAGHFKQTKNGAILEAIINIIISVILVYKYGLIGVSIGTLCAAVFRTVQYSIYASKHICRRPIWLFLKHIVSSVVSCLIVVGLSVFFVDFNCINYIEWIISALTVSIFTCIVVIGVNVVLFRHDMEILILKIRNAVCRVRR